MPVYDAKCRNCGALGQYLSTVEERYSIPPCPMCGGERSKIILTAPVGYVKGFDAFRSPIDKSIIANDRALQEHNRRNQVVQVQEGYDEAKVLSGDFSKESKGPDKKDIAKDIGESIYKLKSGYQPPPREAYRE